MPEGYFTGGASIDYTPPLDTTPTPPPPAVAGYVQSNIAKYDAAAVVDLNALAAPVSAGSVLVVTECEGVGAGHHITGITGYGAAWSQLVSDHGYMSVAIWIGVDPTPGVDTIEATFDGAGSLSGLGVFELSGVAQTDVPIAAFAQHDVTTASPLVTPELDTTRDNQLYLAVVSGSPRSLAFDSVSSGVAEGAAEVKYDTGGGAFADHLAITTPNGPTSASYTHFATNEWAGAAVLLDHA